MKTINVTFEDSEYKALKKLKGNASWRKFILNTNKAYIYDPTTNTYSMYTTKVEPKRNLRNKKID